MLCALLFGFVPLRLTADELGQATPIAAAANELYKQAKMVGEADSDMSAVYNAVNPAAK